MREENAVEKSGGGHLAASSEDPDGDVTIQCLQSSEFVVGKQTNFNGPVMIISCADSSEAADPGNEGTKQNQESIVIRDKVLSPSGAEPGEGEGANKGKSGEGGKGRKKRKVLETLRKLPKVPVVVCIGVLVASGVALAVVLLALSEEPEGESVGAHRLYSKQNWKGKPPRSSVEMKLPVPYVVVSHTVTHQCFRFKACSLLLQNMQDYHMDKDFADIGYNFLVDSSGNLYEGRGWSKRSPGGGFVNGRNIDVAFIGDYSENLYPTEKLLAGFKDLLEFGLENGKISPDYSLVASNATFPTLSPGKNAYEMIKTWPHFDEDPKSHVKDFYDR